MANGSGNAIYIKNPDRRIQMHIVKQNGRYLSDVMHGDPNVDEDIINAAAESDIYGIRNVMMFKQYHPSEEKVLEFLTNPKVMRQPRNAYEDFLKQVYPTNDLLQRKWLRYWDSNNRGKV